MKIRAKTGCGLPTQSAAGYFKKTCTEKPVKYPLLPAFRLTHICMPKEKAQITTVFIPLRKPHLSRMYLYTSYNPINFSNLSL